VILKRGASVHLKTWLKPWQVAAFAGEALLQRFAAMGYGRHWPVFDHSQGVWVSTTTLVQVSFGEFGLSPGSLLANLRLFLG